MAIRRCAAGVRPQARPGRRELRPAWATRSRTGRCRARLTSVSAVALARGLERDRSGQHPAIELRQGHVHRQIARPQPARPGTPGGLAAAGLDHLQHGRVGRGQRILRHPRPTAKAVALSSTAGRNVSINATQQGRAVAVLQAGDVARRSLQAPPPPAPAAARRPPPDRRSAAGRGRTPAPPTAPPPADGRQHGRIGNLPAGW